MGRDLHKEPFDEGTKAKLDIFRDYLKEWLPVFLSKKEIYFPTINIFEFFAGPGEDITGIPGTPLIILEELQSYHPNINDKNLDVNLYFNEFKKDKFELLQEKLKEIESSKPPYKIKCESLDFQEAFQRCYPQMNANKVANLIFLDQSGVKHISEEIFKQLLELKRTDFLFFISSSTIKRFTLLPQIQQYFNIDESEFKQTDYYNVHRKVLEYYKSLIPKNINYYLAPFSIKKPHGLYGLIFGSGHILGIEKFLKTCWNADPERGEANFDIDDDKIQKGQLELLTGDVKKPKKVELFETELERKILNHEIISDKDVFLFTMEYGMIANHASKVLKKLVNEGKLVKDKFNLTSKVVNPNTPKTILQVK